MKIFRIFVNIIVLALVAGILVIFFQTDKLNKKLIKTKEGAEEVYSTWEKQNNCSENPKVCENDAYSVQFKGWLQQFDEYKERKEKTEQFQAYSFLKDLDNMYIPELKSNGWLSLALCCMVILLFVHLILSLLPKGNSNSHGIKYEQTHNYIYAAASAKPDVLALLRKAVDCAETEPVQSISYLQQSIEASLSSKLTIPALLLCGGLRLKNKIGEVQGREQLRRIISTAPQSSEAKKAQMVLDTFK